VKQETLWCDGVVAVIAVCCTTDVKWCAKADLTSYTASGGQAAGKATVLCALLHLGRELHMQLSEHQMLQDMLIAEGTGGDQSSLYLSPAPAKQCEHQVQAHSKTGAPDWGSRADQQTLWVHQHGFVSLQEFCQLPLLLQPDSPECVSTGKAVISMSSRSQECDKGFLLKYMYVLH